jgi:hypothetical protein
MKPSNAHPTDSSEGTRRDDVLQGNSASVRRPDAGRRGRDTLDYHDLHASLGDFARLLGLRHHLPRTRHADYRQMPIRHSGFCHPAARAKRERIAFHTGRLRRTSSAVWNL